MTALILNLGALKKSPEISASEQEIIGERVSQDAVQDGCIRASVAHTGRGMPVKILEGINSSSGGLAGVGITGMKERIHQIGGYLEIVSDRTGTTVTAEVPVAQSIAARNAS